MALVSPLNCLCDEVDPDQVAVNKEVCLSAENDTPFLSAEFGRLSAVLGHGQGFDR